LYNLSSFELRESGNASGAISVGGLAVGLAFDSVFYPPQANPANVAVTENTTNRFSPLANDAGSELILLSVSADTNGTVAISGTNITYVPTNNFTGIATIGYIIEDDLGNTNGATLTVTVTNIPPLVGPVSYAVLVNSVTNGLTPLTADRVETPGGRLGLVSVSPDGNGTATISANGQQVLFTPANHYAGVATVGYQVSDGIGGTNSSTITVNVVNLSSMPVNARSLAGNLVLSWTNTLGVSLQAATNVAGPYLTIPGATSPYTNLIGTNAAGFYRLTH